MGENQQKIPVDITVVKVVDYPHGSKQPDKALPTNKTEGIRINQDVWNEMITVGKLLCLTKDDPDIYDLFDWVRINLHEGQPYGAGIIARVDAEIAKELGPWDTR